MQNKSNKGTVILLVILIILAAYIAFFKDLPMKETIVVSNNNEEVTNDTTNTDTQDNETTWNKSPKFGLFYPSGFQITESYYLSAGQQGNGVPETQGAPEFSATDGHAVITWGGAQSSCYPTQFGAFEHGVSTIACVNGIRSQMGINNVRSAPLSAAEIKVFGDFVLKNQ